MDESARACQAIDEARIEAALVEAHGSVKRAARALGVPQAALRAHVRATPKLYDVALDIAEARLDAAEAVIARSIRRGPLAARLVAAHALLAMTGKLR